MQSLKYNKDILFILSPILLFPAFLILLSPSKALIASLCLPFLFILPGHALVKIFFPYSAKIDRIILSVFISLILNYSILNATESIFNKITPHSVILAVGMVNLLSWVAFLIYKKIKMIKS